MATLPDEDLVEAVQRQTFNFFWEGAHPSSGLALDRCTARQERTNHKTAVGGSGFGIMAIIVAVERNWIARETALERLGRILDALSAATVYHGAFPHYLNGRTGATIPYHRKDDG
ncbi:MAG: glucoamylase family protein, partial [Steroidobacteraceae bacterium]